MAKRKKPSEVDPDKQATDEAVNEAVEGEAAASLRDVTVVLLEREGGDAQTRWPYELLDSLVERHHRDLLDARIAICWRMSKVRADVDGQLDFGRVVRCNDLMRALSGAASSEPFDFVLVIAHEVWNRKETTPQRASAMLDWLLCQCMPLIDGKTGEQAMDTMNRLMWRTRKPVRTFAENVARFGLWNAREVARSLESFHQMSFLEDEPEAAAEESTKPETVGA